jgi:hypothetical protein
LEEVGAVAEGVAGVGVGSSVDGDGGSIVNEWEISPYSRGEGEMVVKRREWELRLKEHFSRLLRTIPDLITST